MNLAKDYIRYFAVIINAILAISGVYKRIVLYFLPQESALQKGLSEVLVYVIVTVFTIVLVREEVYKDFIDIKQSFKNFIDISTTYLVVAMLVAMVVNVFFSICFGNEFFQVVEKNEKLLLTAVSAVIFAPIYEEITMRLAMFKIISKVGVKLSVVATSILFALLHTKSIQSLSSIDTVLPLVSLFILGVTSNVAYIKYNNIFYSIGIHFFWNLCIIVGQFLIKLMI